MKYRIVTSLALLVVSILQVGYVQADTPPNIVVVLADDHAFEAISAYETYLKDYAKTPNIDRLASEGMRFDDFTCCNSICSPSRAAILTGQYSHINGMTGLNGTIHETSPQYPVGLQDAGYQTWVVGKWHMKNQPVGYEKHMVVKGQGSYFNPTFSGSEGVWEREGYSTDVYTDIAMDWLESRDHDRPFLLCLQFKAPHHDYGHAERYDDLLTGVEIPEPSTLYQNVRESDSTMLRTFLETTKFHMLHSGGKNGDGESYYTRHINDDEPDAMGPHDPTSDEDRIRVAYQHMMHKYIRCATGNDDNLKRVLDYLDAENLAENTVVVYTSDQGYWLGQHGLYDKRLILETSLRMPFLIRYPKLIEPGTVSEDLCINVDLAPTLLDLAGAEIPESMQGRSMVPILKGETPEDWRQSQFYTYWGSPHHYGIRTDRYTYVQMGDGSLELYDRESDPDQTHNASGDAEYATTIERLDAELERQVESVEITPEQLP
jgi:arylsulfatase A-like enzyme